MFGEFEVVPADVLALRDVRALHPGRRCPRLADQIACAVVSLTRFPVGALDGPGEVREQLARIAQCRHDVTFTSQTGEGATRLPPREIGKASRERLKLRSQVRFSRRAAVQTKALKLGCRQRPLHVRADRVFSTHRHDTPLCGEPEHEDANRRRDGSVTHAFRSGPVREVLGQEPEGAELEQRAAERHPVVDDGVLRGGLISDLGRVEGHEAENSHAGDEQASRLPVGHGVRPLTTPHPWSRLTARIHSSTRSTISSGVDVPAVMPTVLAVRNQSGSRSVSVWM